MAVAEAPPVREPRRTAHETGFVSGEPPQLAGREITDPEIPDLGTIGLGAQEGEVLEVGRPGRPGGAPLPAGKRKVTAVPPGDEHAARPFAIQDERDHVPVGGNGCAAGVGDPGHVDG